MSRTGPLVRTALGMVDDAVGRSVVGVAGAADLLPVALRTFPTLCSPDTWVVRGRVVAHRPLAPPEVDAPWWRNLRDVVRRYTALDVAGARVAVSLPGEGGSHEVVADREGYLRLEVPAPPGVRPDPLGWVSAGLELVSPTARNAPVRATAHLQVASPRAGFLVVSDLDDTVLQTGLTQGLTALRTTMLTNARTRSPYDGVAGFYRALQRGSTGRGGRGGPHPLAYVSGSPWTIVDLLLATLTWNGVPAGAMELEDWGLEADSWFTPGTQAHKLDRVEELLAAVPHLPVVLVGDSGQRDPETYAEVVARHGDRVLAIYLRDIGTGDREREVRRLCRGITACSGVPVVLSEATGPAVAHALELGLVERSAVAALLPPPGQRGWVSTRRVPAPRT